MVKIGNTTDNPEGLRKVTGFWSRKRETVRHSWKAMLRVLGRIQGEMERRALLHLKEFTLERIIVY